eukprot:705749-Rhodomonas_salina.1
MSVPEIAYVSTGDCVCQYRKAHMSVPEMPYVSTGEGVCEYRRGGRKRGGVPRARERAFSCSAHSALMSNTLTCPVPQCAD